MSNTQHLSTSFGDFDVFVDENIKDKEKQAVEELIENLHAANCKESYLDSDGKVYAVEIGFYYGSKYVELDEPCDNENEATVIAAEKLIEDLENEF